MTTADAHVEVICPGMLDVLSIGKGDLKLSFDPENSDDTEKAKAVIEEMLRKGYSIFVETDVGPARVQRFSAERMAYIITELAPGNVLPSGPAPSPALAPGDVIVDAEVLEDVEGPQEGSIPNPKKTVEKEVPVAGSRATAVGRTAGG
jgi:hypothetical protein